MSSTSYTPALFSFRRWQFLLALAFVIYPWHAISAQDDLFSFAPESWQEAFLTREIWWGSAPRPETYSVERPGRFQLFRMPAGFLYEPIGLDTGDDPTLSQEATWPTSPSAPGDDRLQVVLGSDNPFFDFRSRGDPGGGGYYRLHYQYLLVDGSKTALCLNCRAVTPAGLECDGLAHGHTTISPALAWYQELAGETALHGFVGNRIAAGSRWSDNLEQSFQYGVAVQRPLPGLTLSPAGSLHMFLEALGQRNNGELAPRPPSPWEVLPGLHWQWGQYWWMSGGMIFPVGGSRADAGLWHITCSWRF